MSYLGIDIIGTHNPNTIGIVDITVYDSANQIINSPTIEITPPNFGKVALAFTPREVNIFNSNNLKLSNSQNSEGLSVLPDGIWRLTYSFVPSSTNFVRKKFLRVDAIMQRYYSAFLTIDFSDCAEDSYCYKTKKEKEEKLAEAELLIKGAVAAANKDMDSEALDMYRKADLILSRINICKTC